MFEIRVNVLLFTLPSNVAFISNALIASNLFLLDPMPPYDRNRHADRPRYENAHGGGEQAYKMMVESNRRIQSMTAPLREDKTRAVEVQREQVDEVFKSLGNGVELEQCDPGEYPPERS
jgi:SWI/SNF-related matrix-associated actin-dependent regulator of chromatin subfamily A3